MTTMKFLLDATNQTYSADALGYIAGLEEDGINKAAQTLGISAGAIAGAMAEERMDYGWLHPKQMLADHFAEYGTPLDEEELRLVPTMSDDTAYAVALDHTVSLTPRTHETWVAD
jgi:hypothetical protein